MTENPQRLAVGDLIGVRYRVEAVLGAGGAGAVYRVRDERADRTLALKRLHAQSGKEGAALAAHFEHEYHTLCQLAHPRIISVYDYGVDAGGAYYTMELLDGLDLHSLGKRPWRQGCALLRDVASSLAIVHSRRLVHRDVSARNVRCTSDGRAKLIDFGVMAPMGVARHVAGTAPYLPPESLELLGLDGRADLYALGALAYWLLTGYHAYHARSFGQLRNLWRSAPLPPRQYESDVPVALDQLVMELLHLERGARPDNAAEVIERLSGIAGLPLEELPEVQRSYLVMPTLVGRDAAVALVRETLTRSLQTGQGLSLAIEGESGIGRSRLLEASILEAKLLGFLVLRGDASDSASGEYGVIRALCEQLWLAAPELCEQAGQRRRALLTQVLPGLGPSASEAPPQDRGQVSSSDRKKLQSALQEFVLAIARNKRLLLAVDDVESIDEPSSALLGVLAHVAKQRALVLVTTSQQGAAPCPLVALLRELSTTVPIEPLEPEQTAALLRSVFGDVDHVTALAERVHGLAQGNPRWTMALVDHLLDRGSARYEAGSWALASELGPQDLPSTLTAALSARLDRLQPDARALAEALALTDASRIPVDRYPSLCDYDDRGRCYHALDEIVAAGVLIADGERYRFRQAELATLLEHALSPAHARTVHARIADAIGTVCDDVVLLSHHLLRGGREREAVELLLPMTDQAIGVFSREALELFDEVVLTAERLNLPAASVRKLRVRLLGYAAVRGERALFLRHGPDLLAALVLSQARPELETSDPSESSAQDAMMLGRVAVCFVAMGVVACELQLFEMLPPLESLVAKQPMLGIAHKFVEMHTATVQGFHARAHQRAREILACFAATGDKGTDPSFARDLRVGVQYFLGVVYATGGNPAVGEWLVEFQHAPGYRANAARIRMIYDLMRGHADAANGWRRRAEVLGVQDGNLAVLPGTTTVCELTAAVFADNLIGVKRAVERIELLAEKYPGWRPYLSIGRAHYRRLQGDLRGALEALEPALCDAPCGRHAAWGWASGTHVALTTALGERARALELAVRYMGMSERTAYAFSHPALALASFEAFANAGRGELARTRMEAFLQSLATLGTRGLTLGLAYETAARIAIAQNDEAGFNHYAELCAQEYAGGRDLMLEAKYERLMREAEDNGLPNAQSLPPSAVRQRRRTLEPVRG